MSRQSRQSAVRTAPAPLAIRWPRVCRPGAGLALALVLAYGLLEPALCILHCQLWPPAHAHAGHQHTTESASVVAGPAASVVAQLRSAGVTCVMRLAGESPETPLPPPPSPVRDAALLVAAQLLVLLVASPILTPIAPRVVWRTPDPPLRPPALNP